MGWQFTLAEFLGGPLMVAIMAVLFRLLVSEKLIQAAREQAEKGLAGKMEGHAEMDMSVTEGPLLRRIFSEKGRTAISHYFVMDWMAIGRDIALGLLLAGVMAAFVPKGFLSALFLQGHPTLAKFWGPVIGPLVAVISFVCSVGNVPLAAVLWTGGISFGGVISFLFADLLILPILNIYRKYYGGRTALYLLAVSYVAMALAGFLVGGAFQLLGLAPTNHHVSIFETQPSWNYTTFLDIAFLLLTTVLAWRFITTGGIEMLRAHSR